MSDPVAELRPAVKAMLRADPGVMLAFAGKPVQVVDFAAANLSPPYVVLGAAAVEPELAECIDGGAVELTIDAFSRTQPPAFAEVARIAAAVQLALASDDLVLASHRVCSFEPISGRYLTDPDTVTAHAVMVVRFHTEPI